ncbi:MAG: helix-turn-helix domain-containing protein [Pseudomonadota bacterium]
MSAMRKAVAEMAAGRMTLSEASRHFGVSKSGLRRAARGIGYQKIAGRHPLMPHIAEAARMVIAGAKYREACAATGASPGAVHAAVTAHKTGRRPL